jgi:hypothetical protein
MTNVVRNTTYKLLILVTDNTGAGVVGLTINYSIYDNNNTLVYSGTLSDSGNGIYDDSYVFTDINQYYILYETPNGYTNEIEHINIVQDYAKETTLLRALGLSDENKRILNTIHDSNGSLTNATIKIYPNATDFENDTNVLAVYEYEATYNTLGLMQTMGIKRIL